MAARNNQLISLYIYCILKLDASGVQPYSAPMVHRRLQELGIELDRKTVLNHVKLLADQFPDSEADYRSFLSEYLCSTIHRFRKDEASPTGYTEIISEDDVPDGGVFYYYIEGSILPEELELLQSTIEINQYLSAEKTRELISDIEQMKPFAYRDQSLAFSGQDLKKSSTDIFRNLSILRDSIRKKKKVSVLYGRYNRHLVLTPTSEKPRTINPYAVMSSNGYYYLIAGNPKYDNNLSNFRIDRILDIEILEDAREPIPDKLLPYFRDASRLVFQAGQYRNDHPVMYSDESVRIHLSCSPSIINNILDDFGWSVRVRDIPDPDHPDWVHITAQASLMGAAVFCTHHCNTCKVLSPDILKEKVIRNLQEGLDLYRSQS
jgi:predicted DNA-binding transcriptional regulator YafY